jgi:hypothetical protein
MAHPVDKGAIRRRTVSANRGLFVAQSASTAPILGISFSANRPYTLSMLETDLGDGVSRS